MCHRDVSYNIRIPHATPASHATIIKIVHAVRPSSKTRHDAARQRTARKTKELAIVPRMPINEKTTSKTRSDVEGERKASGNPKMAKQKNPETTTGSKSIGKT